MRKGILGCTITIRNTDGSLMTTRDMMTVNIMVRRQCRDFQEDRAHPIIRGHPMTSVLQRKKEAC